MKEEQKNQKQPNLSEETKISSSGWKKMFRKKWFFPAVYLIAAALILALITWYQNPNDFAMDKEELGYDTVDFESTLEEDREDVAAGEEAIPVNTAQEKMVWPIAETEDVLVVLNYFDDNATEEQNMEAMVEYDNTFYPSKGISLSKEDNKESFDVLAALSGKVIAADKKPLVGYYVEIEHEDGLVTVYQSLEDLQVVEGDTVQQGDVLGRAGRNDLEKDLGVHVHFEVHENGEPVNPDKFFSEAE